MSEITIIGAGFGAITAALALRKADRDASITVIAPSAEFVYYPSLIWIPTGLRKGDDLRFDLNPLFRKHRIRFVADRVTGLKAGGRVVVTDAGEVRNDGLIIASGGRFLKKLPGIEHALTVCEGIEPAQRMRERLTALSGGTIAIGFGANPKEPSAVRGGPMFEILFGIDTYLRQQGRRERFEIVFFNPAQRPGQRLGERAVDGLLAEMKRRGIRTELGHKPVRFESDKVVTEGSEFAADLILFMPGMTGPAWVEGSELPLSEGGLIKGDQHCRVPGFDRVYVVGDSGSFPGPDWMPKQAHMADLQARAAVRNLLAELSGTQPSHIFRVELICIVDTLNSGILVYRSPKRVIVWESRLFHPAKKFFEWWYLRHLRRGNPKSGEHAASV
ncbi:MAG: NAD(P)/FAD-dependent oxidoreductase [Thiotrichales bacterium]